MKMIAIVICIALCMIAAPVMATINTPADAIVLKSDENGYQSYVILYKPIGFVFESSPGAGTLILEKNGQIEWSTKFDWWYAPSNEHTVGVRVYIPEKKLSGMLSFTDENQIQVWHLYVNELNIDIKFVRDIRENQQKTYRGADYGDGGNPYMLKAPYISKYGVSTPSSENRDLVMEV